MILSSSTDGSVFLHTTLIFVIQSKENKITKSDWIFRRREEQIKGTLFF